MSFVHRLLFWLKCLKIFFLLRIMNRFFRFGIRVTHLVARNQRRSLTGQAAEATSDVLNAKTYLRRAILYVPGNDQRKIDKVTKSTDPIDSIVFDCEDGVAINKKVCRLKID